jgi:hypothetical protein
VDIYSRNPFRLLALPAAAETPILNRAAQRVRLRMRATGVPPGAIASGYDDLAPLEPGDVIEALEVLGDPRRRLIHELFWPASEDGMRTFLQRGRFGVDTNPGFDSGAHILWIHARAVAFDNAAIGLELRGDPQRALEYWRRGLGAWGRVLNDESWWAHVETRIDALQDPRLCGASLSALRRELPAAVLGLRLAFIKKHAAARRSELCREHLASLRGAAFGAELVHAACAEAVRGAAAARLRAVEAELASELAALDEPVSFRELEKLTAPMLERAAQLAADIFEETGGAREELAGALDPFAASMAGALDRHLSVSASEPERARTLMFRSCVLRGLRELPVSRELAAELEHRALEDRAALYRGLEPAAPVDVTRCWFLPQLPADPDACVAIDLYRVDEVTRAGLGAALRSRAADP